MFRRSLMRRSLEMLIAAPPSTAMRDNEGVARHREVVQQLARLVVIDHRADRYRNLNRTAVAARSIAALPMTAALGFMFGIESEMKESDVVVAGDERDVPAATTVAAAGAAARDVLLAPERKTPVAAVAGFDLNPDFV